MFWIKNFKMFSSSGLNGANIEEEIRDWLKSIDHLRIVAITESCTGKKGEASFFHNVTIYYESAN